MGAQNPILLTIGGAAVLETVRRPGDPVRIHSGTNGEMVAKIAASGDLIVSVKPFLGILFISLSRRGCF